MFKKCLFTVFFLATSAVYAAEQSDLPSVSRQVVICDQWQWIGGGAITWGCLKPPRTASVAGGQATDEALKILQDQIKALEERIKKLETR